MSDKMREKLMAGLAKRDKSMLADPHLNNLGNTVRKTGSVVSREKIFELPVDQINDNPFQYRDETSLNNSELESLAKSIQEHGLRSPIQVRRKGEEYILVAGWRRLTAIRRFLPDLKNVKATIDSTMDDRTHRMLTIIENEQREDFTAFEKARAYADMKSIDNLTLEEIATIVGSSVTRISRILKLLTLPEEIAQVLRKAILDGLSLGHLDELAAGYKKRETLGETPQVLKAWIEDLVQRILSGELTIADLRETNKQISNGSKLSVIKEKPWKIKGGSWSKFEVNEKQQVTLQFKLPESIEKHNTDQLVDYIKNQLLNN